MFDELIAWAERVASLPNVRLGSYSGQRYTLLPRVMPDKVGLVTIWNDNQQPYISVWRSVFERLAPNSIEAVEKVIAPIKIGQGNTVRHITPKCLTRWRQPIKRRAGVDVHALPALLGASSLSPTFPRSAPWVRRNPVRVLPI